jgi:hypothetical protein
MLIFAAGGVASIYEGLDKLRHPESIQHVPLILAILALSFLFETLSFVASWRESERGRPKLSRRRYPQVTRLQFIHLSPNPAVYTLIDGGVPSGLARRGGTGRGVVVSVGSAVVFVKVLLSRVERATVA